MDGVLTAMKTYMTMRKKDDDDFVTVTMRTVMIITIKETMMTIITKTL